MSASTLIRWSNAPRKCSKPDSTATPKRHSRVGEFKLAGFGHPTFENRNFMSLLDQLGGVLNNVMGGNLSEQQTQDHYDQIANSVPQNQLGAAIGPALASLGSGEIQQRVSNSAAQMDSQQRGNMVQTLLGGLGNAGNLGGLLSQLGISPSVQNDPQTATPDDLGKLAAHAQTNNPGVFHEAMSFYSAHPTLVKALGTAAIAGIARHLAKS